MMFGEKKIDWKKWLLLQKQSSLLREQRVLSIDKTIYTEQNVTEAISKIKNANKAEENFGDDSNDDWGDGTNFDDGDDEAWD